jgi:hypothetical protein
MFQGDEHSIEEFVDLGDMEHPHPERYAALRKLALHVTVQVEQRGASLENKKLSDT